MLTSLTKGNTRHSTRRSAYTAFDLLPNQHARNRDSSAGIPLKPWPGKSNDRRSTAGRVKVIFFKRPVRLRLAQPSVQKLLGVLFLGVKLQGRDFNHPPAPWRENLFVEVMNTCTNDYTSTQVFKAW